MESLIHSLHKVSNSSLQLLDTCTSTPPPQVPSWLTVGGGGGGGGHGTTVVVLTHEASWV